MPPSEAYVAPPGREVLVADNGTRAVGLAGIRGIAGAPLVRGVVARLA